MIHFDEKTGEGVNLFPEIDRFVENVMLLYAKIRKVPPKHVMEAKPQAKATRTMVDALAFYYTDRLRKRDPGKDGKKDEKRRFNLSITVMRQKHRELKEKVLDMTKKWIKNEPPSGTRDE